MEEVREIDISIIIDTNKRTIRFEETVYSINEAIEKLQELREEL